MTPEERATKLVATSLDDWCGDNGDQKPHGLYLGQMILEIAAAIREAVEAECERCAKICDELYAKEWDYDPAIATGARDCAAAIRYRSSQETDAPNRNALRVGEGKKRLPVAKEFVPGNPHKAAK